MLRDGVGDTVAVGSQVRAHTAKENVASESRWVVLFVVAVLVALATVMHSTHSANATSSSSCTPLTTSSDSSLHDLNEVTFRCDIMVSSLKVEVPSTLRSQYGDFPHIDWGHGSVGDCPATGADTFGCSGFTIPAQSDIMVFYYLTQSCGTSGVRASVAVNGGPAFVVAGHCGGKSPGIARIASIGGGRGKVTTTVACPADRDSCEIAVTGTVKGKKVLGDSATVAQSFYGTLSTKLNALGKKLVRADHTIKVKVEVMAISPDSGSERKVGAKTVKVT